MRRIAHLTAIFIIILNLPAKAKTDTIFGEVWDGNSGPLSGSYYIPPFNNITIPEGRILTIAPGSTLNFDTDASVEVYGTLIAVSPFNNEQDRILFTRFGETYWNTIHARDNSKIFLSNCIIEYTGTNLSNFQSIRLSSPDSAFISNCIIRNGHGDAILGNMGILIDTNNNGAPVPILKISENQIYNFTGSGIFLTRFFYPIISLEGNTIKHCGTSAMHLSGQIFPTQDNILDSNGFDGVLIHGDIGYNELPNTPLSGTYYYNIRVPLGDGSFYPGGIIVGDTCKLTLNPGIRIMLGNLRKFIVNGELTAIGNEDNHIQFINDSINSYGFGPEIYGKSKFENCDFDSMRLYSLSFGSYSNVEIDRCVFRNGWNDIDTTGFGIAGSVGFYAMSPGFTSGKFILRNSTISGMPGTGLSIRVIDSGWAEIECNNITNNNFDGVYIERDRSYGLGGDSLIFVNNKISNNRRNGLTGSGVFYLDVSNNWWGDPSGPGGIGQGEGDEIAAGYQNDTINFSPWLTSADIAACGATDIKETLYDRNNSINIFPNPAKNNAKIEFELNRNGNVSVIIYNTLGIIKTEVTADNFFKQGSHNLSVDISEFEIGCYFVRMIVQSDIPEIYTKKLIILK